MILESLTVKVLDEDIPLQDARKFQQQSLGKKAVKR
jgi:hypothetical protein